MVDRIRLGLMSGWLSCALWFVVFTPQIWECYVLQSGEGLSVIFLVIWLIGDLTGVIGALIQKLVITVSLLGIYYMLCDMLLLSMLFYYRYKRRNYPELFPKSGQSGIHKRALANDTERTPLLNNGHSVADDDEDDYDEETSTFLTKVKRWARTHTESLIAYALATAFIVTVGIVAWFSTAKHSNIPQADEEWSTPGQIVGWISAFLYLSSRIPQINKNRSTKCQGLSLMMFCFSVCGNITYCGSILFPSTSPQHVWINTSWLVGAAGTIFLDFIVLGQFIYYRKDREQGVYIEGGESQISGI